jgi:hypothetical protein
MDLFIYYYYCVFCIFVWYLCVSGPFCILEVKVWGWIKGVAQGHSDGNGINEGYSPGGMDHKDVSKLLPHSLAVRAWL